ncbi:MAG: hypothetical protein L3J45_01755 [Flavobacteriaceae bacterium]|nr:hypothetical protein [Flavobacteriaceae bacterium]
MKALFIPYIYISFFLGFTSGFSQQLALKIKTKSTTNTSVIQSVKFKKNHINKVGILREIDSVKNILSEKGFLKSKLDSLYKTDSIYTAIFSLGIPFKKISVSYKKPISKSLLKEKTISYNDSTFTISWVSIKPFLSNLVNLYENKGYPFAQIHLTNIHLKKDKAFANLEVTSTKLRSIDEIVIKGYSDFPQTFITHYLNLKSKSIFNIAKLKKASIQIKNLAFADELKPPEILFTKNKTILYLYLKKKQTNYFDGLLGFTSKEQGNGVLFDGYLDIKLNNIFDTGETLALLFKSNGNAQQKLNLKASFPYAFKSKITPTIDFNLFKQDTSFINISSNIKIQYPINQHSKIGLVISQKSSSNLLTNTSSDIQSYNAFYYGLSYSFNTFNNDDLFNQKFNFNIKTLKGSKKIESVKENQTIIDITTSYLWLLNYKNAIFIKNNSAVLNTANYMTNELFRIGGFNSIRGFNEESIFASSYSILNLEYRYKTNKYEYFYTISDFGHFSNQLNTINSNLYSLGLGYLFSTKIGQLNLSYVLGKIKTKDLKISDAKLHINFNVNF